jgi:hypothetical protein
MRALSRVFSFSNSATLSFKPSFFGCFIWFLRRSEHRAIPPARRAIKPHQKFSAHIYYGFFGMIFLFSNDVPKSTLAASVWPAQPVTTHMDAPSALLGIANIDDDGGFALQLLPQLAPTHDRPPPSVCLESPEINAVTFGDLGRIASDEPDQLCRARTEIPVNVEVIRISLIADDYDDLAFNAAIRSTSPLAG